MAVGLVGQVGLVGEDGKVIFPREGGQGDKLGDLFRR